MNGSDFPANGDAYARDKHYKREGGGNRFADSKG